EDDVAVRQSLLDLLRIGTREPIEQGGAAVAVPRSVGACRDEVVAATKDLHDFLSTLRREPAFSLLESSGLTVSSWSREVIVETYQGTPEGRRVKAPFNGTVTEEEMTVLT